MFTKRIIPCLDVNNGRVVKGVNFVNLKRCRRSGGNCEQLTMQAGADEAGISWISQLLRDTSVTQ